jgi:hypothetical protein
MSILPKNQLELLKGQVIMTAGLTSITPADCKLLSMLINNKTKQCLSETTLKRIYGFALSNFQPSLFTLDALAKFCGYNGTKDFLEKTEKTEHSGKKAGSDEFSWLTLRQNANKITNFTLQALKNRSGIPFKQTIKRDFFYRFLSDFNHSGLTAALISAPAGYGKTVGLCHWVEDKIEDVNSNDIVLFFSSTALMSVLFTGMDINNWLQTLLGYSATHKMGSIKGDERGIFYLVIDGLDDGRIKEEQFDLILHQVNDFISIYNETGKFKLILTMRTSTWQNYRHQIEDEHHVWFTEFKANGDFINTPLFNMDEIRKLTAKINPTSKLPNELPESFKNPLYFQLFYKQYKENFSFENIDRTSDYELNALYILNKIYLGKYSTEKILIIKALVEAMDFEHHHYHVDKLKVNDITRKYDHAYAELLSAGILKEVNETGDYQYNAYLKFVNNYFLTHSIAKILLYSNSDLFNSALIEKINTAFAKSEQKLPVLKYCIIHAIKTGQQNSFEQLSEVHLSPAEKADLINFLGDLLSKNLFLLKGNEALQQYFNQDFGKKLFDYFFGIELINNDYKKTLQTLLKFELSNRKKILVYTALGLVATINLNMDDLDDILKKLKGFNMADFQSFAVNPLHCLDALFHYFKHGVVKKEALTDMTKLAFNFPEDEYNLRPCSANDMLYLLGLYTSLISNNAKKVMRLMDVIKKHYKTDCMEHSASQYGFFMHILAADAHYKLGNTEKLAEIHRKINDAYKKSDNRLSSFMRSLLHCLKIKLLLDTPNENAIINEMKCVDIISLEYGSQVNKLSTLVLLLHKESFLEQHPNFKKQVNYDFMKIIRNNGLFSEPFFTLKKIAH